ncbi:hypothetical protein Pyn_27917 [Prunus yedoensis var. nudiflora]|uniref:Uncharacterized protein n=1 Tax=Prunus yedoensis var. nudiflora TaxID=2094558 RepID=A0A314Y6U0_PRUYE|nr:hypothetical protein Pyn_27917 [Prunus yedoensis var. nudiflora]
MTFASSATPAIIAVSLSFFSQTRVRYPGPLVLCNGELNSFHSPTVPQLPNENC